MTQAQTLRTLVALVSVLMLAGGAFAADVVGSATDATWQLDKAAHGGTLTVTGPAGFSMQKAFAGGEAPTFSIWDKAGYALPDGQYHWNLSLDAAKAERGGKAVEKAGSYSGTFRIENGSLLVPSASGAGDSDVMTKDQIIADDLIVQFSACIGTDCVNGENFGFDTLRLKENNLRIKFDDTSNSASFPNVDWQLTANDSSNGGANKFSIDDITNGRTPFTILASAPSNSLFVNAAGEVGFGTNTPVVELHVRDGDSPALRLEQDGSAGFQPQTWDVAGNETNFFVRDATNSSKLPFKIKPNAPTDSLFVAASGDIGMGTASPDSEMHMRSTAASGMRLHVENANASSQNVNVRVSNSTRSWDLRNNTAGNFALTVAGSGNNDLVIDGSTGQMTVRHLAGTGSASVCVDASGNLFRGNPGC